MPASAVAAAVDAAQRGWTRSVTTEGLRAARLALDRARGRDTLAAIVTAIVRRNVDAAVDAALIDLSGTLHPAGVTTSSRPPDLPAAPSIDVVEAVQRAWRRAQVASAPGQDVDPNVLTSDVARIVADTLTDTYRDAQLAAMRATPDVIGWRRVSQPGCCGACLAMTNGRVMPLDMLFPAHPRCRCLPEPVIRDVNERATRETGAQRWERMTVAEQDEMFRGHGGAAKAALLRDGAIALHDLIAAEPRRPGQRPLVREATLTELNPA